MRQVISGAAEDNSPVVRIGGVERVLTSVEAYKIMHQMELARTKVDGTPIRVGSAEEILDEIEEYTGLARAHCDKFDEAVATLWPKGAINRPKTYAELVRAVGSSPVKTLSSVPSDLAVPRDKFQVIEDAAKKEAILLAQIAHMDELMAARAAS